MLRNNITIKVALGYALIIAIMAVAVWLIAGNSRAMLQMAEEERTYVARRTLVDSLVYSFMQASNAEQAICMNMDQWDIFDHHIRNTISLADSLDRATDGRMSQRIDSLKAHLMMMSRNTVAIMHAMARFAPGAALDRKVRSLREGGDSVVIVADSTQRRQETRTTVEVVRSRKGFFRRLADAFRKQYEDTVAVEEQTTMHADTALQRVDIAGDVAQALAEVQNEEQERHRDNSARLRDKVWRQQRAGMVMTNRIQQIISQLREEEYATRQAAFDTDQQKRRDMLAHIVALSVISIVAAAILLYLVWRDNRRAERYREGLQHAKDETERLMLTITHDIKAPAASIAGFIDLLRDEMTAARANIGRTGEYLTNIKATADHLLRLVRALLDHRQMQEGTTTLRPVSFNASQLIEECVAGMEPLVRQRGLTLRCAADASCDRRCIADAFRLRQIMENLIGNAVKYTMEGGITVTASMQDRMLRICLADTGVGMTEEETERIFQAFTRLDSADGTEGTGLGLSITSEFVSLLGGTITVRSVKGEGTVFHIEIPVEEDNGEKDAVEESETVQGTFRNILIVDDDPLQLRLVCELLGQLRAADGSPLQVTTLQSASRAFEILTTLRPDAMLVDVEMPEMDGRQLAERISDTASHIHLIAMTAHEPGIRPELIRAGFNDCLFKPIRRSDMIRALGLADSGATTAATPYDTSALTAFADGDEEAKAEILRCFKEQMEELTGILDEGIENCDRRKIAHVAHKATPTLTMIGFKGQDILSALTPEHISEHDDEETLRLARRLRKLFGCLVV